jgi:hypothetical protein
MEDNKLIVLVVVYNQPDFLEYQYHCLKKFMKVPFRCMIFDNSEQDCITTKFVEICKELHIEYYRVPDHIRMYAGDSLRAGRSLDYALQYIYDTNYKGIVMVNDSDLFLVKEYNPLDAIKDYEMVGRSIKNIYRRNESIEHPINTYNIDYFSNQFLIINYAKVKDICKISFVPSSINGISVDCGGKLYEYFKEIEGNYDSIADYCSGYSMNEIYNITDLDDTIKSYLIRDVEINGKSFSEVFDNSFIHFRAGSNWINHSNDVYLQRRNNLIRLLHQLKVCNTSEMIVCTVVYNTPRFIEYQYECLKKYMMTPFRFIVFDNSLGDDEIPRHCSYAGATYVRVPPHIHHDNSPSYRAGASLDYALRYIYHDMGYRGVVMVNDSDLFLIDNYNPVEKLGQYDIIGIEQNKDGLFYTNQFMLMNFGTLPNFNNISFVPGDGKDCGGLLVNYFHHNPDVKHRGCYIVNSGFLNSTNIDFASDTYKDYFRNEINIINTGDYANRSFSEIVDHVFLHLRAGSNWNNFPENIVFAREDNLFTFLSNRLIDWKLQHDPQNKYVISFSLYGNNPKYTHNAIINAILAKKVYNGWICRFYVDDTVPENIIRVLSSYPHVEIVKIAETNDAPTGDKMLWRFYPASDGTVAAMISRDCDSWLSFREAYSTKKWIESEKQFHIIRDHCYHSQKIMGGMWGIKRGKVANMHSLCQEYVKNNTYDQGFLADNIYPIILDSVMVHIGEDQRMMGGAPSHGYFPDGGRPFEPYPSILEFIPGIDMERANDVNVFNCCHCGKNHTFFIGEMMNNWHQSTYHLSKVIGL